MQTPASFVVDKAARLANGNTILPVKTLTDPLTWMSESYLRVLWKPAPHPEARDPKRATISLEIDAETKQHFEHLEAEVQKQIPSQTLPNGKYLTSYDLKDATRHRVPEGQNRLRKSALLRRFPADHGRARRARKQDRARGSPGPASVGGTRPGEPVPGKFRRHAGAEGRGRPLMPFYGRLNLQKSNNKALRRQPKLVGPAPLLETKPTPTRKTWHHLHASKRRCAQPSPRAPARAPPWLEPLCFLLHAAPMARASSTSLNLMAQHAIGELLLPGDWLAPTHQVVGLRPATDPRRPQRLRALALRNCLKRLVRSLQPNGKFHVTGLGKVFFQDKFTEYLAHVPVIIRGTRRRGRNAGQAYERPDMLPVTTLGLRQTRLNDALSQQEILARIKQDVFAQGLADGQGNRIIMEQSEEVYFLDNSRDWVISSQSTQYINDEVRVETLLNQRLARVRDVSFQLFASHEILDEAFEP